MEKTIRCPECGSNVKPDEFNSCPDCQYIFKSFDYQQQGVKEEDFHGPQPMKLNSRMIGKAKVIAFLVVLLFILFKIITHK